MLWYLQLVDDYIATPMGNNRETETEQRKKEEKEERGVVSGTLVNIKALALGPFSEGKKKVGK